MPTLHSVHVAPELVQKLRDDVYPSIHTPLALLARDPASTAAQLKVPCSYWNQIRARVADSVLCQTSTETLRIARKRMRQDDEHDCSSNKLIIGSLCASEYRRHYTTNDASRPMIPGCSTLNRWLSRSRLIQITGSSSSGKTQLCLTIAVSWVQQRMESLLVEHQHPQCYPQCSVLYITTTTPPASLARRLRQLVVAAASTTDLSCSGGDRMRIHHQRQVLNRIHLMLLSTPLELLVTLQQLMDDESNPNHDDSGTPPTPLLVVLDSASGCLGGCNDWNLLNQIGVTLKRLVHISHHTTAAGVQVIITNGTTSSGEPALGPTWSSRVPETHIRLQTVEPQRAHASLMDNHSQIETIEFRISLEGIQENPACGNRQSVDGDHTDHAPKVPCDEHNMNGKYLTSFARKTSS